MEEYRGYISKIGKTLPSGDVACDAEIESQKGAGMLPMKVVGAFNRYCREGDWFIATGQTVERTWGEPKRTVREFKAKTIKPDLPRTEAGALAMLDKTFNMRDHGIAPEARRAFAKKHGAGTASKIEQNPDLLLEMTEDPKRFAKAIRNSWSSRLYNLQPIRIMEEAGAKDDVVGAVMKKYGDQTLDIIKTNPYQLMSIKGVGFELADKMAGAIGIGKNDQRRVSAAVTELVAQGLSKGDTYINASKAGMTSALEPLGIEWESFKKLASTVAMAEHAERLGVTIFQSKVGNVIQKIETYRQERSIAKSVAELVARGDKLDRAKIEDATRRVLSQKKYSHLSDEQRAAVETSSRESIAILTGGPGTGKSTVSEAIAEIAAMTISGPLHLVAPTGKAARRLSEATGREAKTVHKLLGSMGEAGFKRGLDNKLEPGCFVLVDESSMLDTALTKALLDALPDDGRILLVGDKDQLPSVDAGYVIGDMLTARAPNGNTVPSSELTKVFRSLGSKNMIAEWAKDMKEGRFDVSPLSPNSIWQTGVSFFTFPDDGIVTQVAHIYCDLMPNDPFNISDKDIVVLCPQRSGRGGTHEINTRLQAKANPNGAVIKGWVRPAGMDKAEPTPKKGDRVMLTANDDTLNIRNGDVGYILDVVDHWDDKKRKVEKVKIKLESGDIVYIPLSMAPYNTIVAYAITGHKSQGSQYQCVIMPISPDHTAMMERTLLYTEWTRAKRYVVMVGNKDVFTAGIENTSSSQRMTLLKTHIEEELDKLPARPRRRPMASATDIHRAAQPTPAPATVNASPAPAAPASSGPPPLVRPSFARPTFEQPKAAPPTRVVPNFAGASQPFSTPFKR
ncbi:ATP-dependent RecD-like DNA helicase [Rhizobium sp. BK176]|uniref:ATP-dependent RecD-like DNA helicase n=1 Tax=Rhizobium sp. BK176 TaxID=2587071 RepID=UPI002168BE6A|nr:ATP-dependent RecD-like DNA helicase [Rhizobium sp. BK176]MCS4089829.1 exodeoxyribonuclease V alpha subunit [Rhizobium sp. BK176]